MQACAGQVRSRISSDLEDLRVLHDKHWWLPSPEQIRPSEHMRVVKEITLEQIAEDYRSPTDYVLISIFGVPHVQLGDGKQAVKDPRSGRAIEAWSAEAVREVFIEYKIKPLKFVPNPFPYSLDQGSHHWVLWYNTPWLVKSDDEVTRDIWREIRRHLRDDPAVQDRIEKSQPGRARTDGCSNADAASGGGANAVEAGGLNDLASIDFAWYVNPKMTIPQLAHVQVFWVTSTVAPGC